MNKSKDADILVEPYLEGNISCVNARTNLIASRICTVTTVYVNVLIGYRHLVTIKYILDQFVPSCKDFYQ